MKKRITYIKQTSSSYPAMESECEYDREGRVVKEVMCEEGKAPSSTNYYYDDLGRETKRLHIYDVDDLSSFSQESSEYDPVHGHIKSTTMSDDDGFVRHRSEFTWDPVRRIEEEVEKAFACTQYERRYKRSFDEQGHLVRSEGFWEDGSRYSFRICRYTGKGEEHKEYYRLWHVLKSGERYWGNIFVKCYDEKGLEYRSYSKSIDYLNSPGKRAGAGIDRDDSVSLYEYDYNEEGDWIRQRYYDNGILESTTERTIIYRE